jgi:hypothetical protein
MQIGCGIRYLALAGAAGWITSAFRYRLAISELLSKISDLRHRSPLDLGLIEVRVGCP